MPTEHHQSELDDLRARLRRLEDAASRPRGRTNLPGAARYLGISEETLRRKHLRGEGPPRTKVGSRNWSYSFVEIDAWLAARDSEAVAS
jgi:predicted DNA-binding transcriptional regulator AlpA